MRSSIPTALSADQGGYPSSSESRRALRLTTWQSGKMSDELAAAAGEKIGNIGASFYFDPTTLARGKELGLGGFQFYVLGRGGVLGNVEPAVIQSAFGYFDGGMIAKIWDGAREVMDPREAGTHYMECARVFGRDKFAAVDGLAGFCDAAETLIANIHPGALALYAGTAAEPLCDDLPGRAMQLAVVLREYRGSAHLAAIIAEGLDPVRAHFLKRPDDYKTFGHAEDPAPGAESESAAHAAAEVRTNAMCGQVFRCLSQTQADAITAGLDAMAEALA